MLFPYFIHVSVCDIAKTGIRYSINIFHGDYGLYIQQLFRIEIDGVIFVLGCQLALTLSDPFCVDRYRDEFLGLIRKKTVDIVFSNQHELRSLYQTADFETAVVALRNEDLLGVVTCSEDGSLVVTREETHAVAAFPIQQLVDTTGAGDLYAAGFLAGLTRSADYVTCARLGGLAAAEVIQHYGARPQANLRDLAAQCGMA
jgi:sugar/nucleoside kinase (ribokinase family)